MKRDEYAEFHSRNGGVEGIEPLLPNRSRDFWHAPIVKGQVNNVEAIAYRENIRARDAMVVGWTLFVPVSFSVIRGEDSTVTVNLEDTAVDDSLVVTTNLGGRDGINLDTLWNLQLPPGYAALVVPPMVKGEAPVEVLPHRVMGDNGCCELAFDCRVMGDGVVPRGESIAQVIPIEEELPEATGRVASAEEAEQIEKDAREHQIYPKRYAKKRDGTRIGTIFTR